MSKTGNQSQARPVNKPAPKPKIELKTLRFRLTPAAAKRVRKIKDWEERSASKHLALTGRD